jgi:hypothetical protein
MTKIDVIKGDAKMETSELKTRLSALKKTMNFETVATRVFGRLIHGYGPGLLLLYGPPHDPPWPEEKKGNKTYFLDVVEALQQGCPAIVQGFVSAELWSLLRQLNAGMYQCINMVNVIREFNLEVGATHYRIPLGVTMSVALALTAQANGFEKGGRVVILCDDLPRFMEYNTGANEQFLIELSHVLNKRREVTFLAAARLRDDDYWNEEFGPKQLLNLGWD